MLNSALPVPQTSGVYQIKNTISRKSYIGSSVRLAKRQIEHARYLSKGQHHSSHLQRAWKKYGAAAFEFIVLELVDAGCLLQREQFFIDALLPEYNTSPTAGSPKGVKHTPQSRRNMSIAHIGQKPTAEQRQKNSVLMKRIWATDPEFRRRCSPKGRKLSPESRQKTSETLKGQKHDPERKRKISETLKAMWKKPEYRQHMSDAHKGKTATPETRHKQSEARKRRRAARTPNLC